MILCISAGALFKTFKTYPENLAGGLHRARVNYSLFPLNVKGQIDKKEWEKGIRLGMELLPPLNDEQHPKQVIDAQDRFAKRRHEYEFKWKLSRKVEEAIGAAIFRQ